VVRVCEPTYKVEELKSEGINVIDLVFDDGTFPPNEVKILSLDYCDKSDRTQTNKCNCIISFITHIHLLGGG